MRRRWPARQGPGRSERRLLGARGRLGGGREQLGGRPARLDGIRLGGRRARLRLGLAPPPLASCSRLLRSPGRTCAVVGAGAAPARLRCAPQSTASAAPAASSARAIGIAGDPPPPSSPLSGCAWGTSPTRVSASGGLDGAVSSSGYSFHSSARRRAAVLGGHALRSGDRGADREQQRERGQRSHQLIVIGVPTGINRPRRSMSRLRIRMHPCETRPGISCGWFVP